MEGKFAKKRTGDIFKLQVKQFDGILGFSFSYRPGMLIVITSGFQEAEQSC
jgi:hypothetical protein